MPVNTDINSAGVRITMTASAGHVPDVVDADSAAEFMDAEAVFTSISSFVQVTTRIEIRNSNDDTARNVRCVVVLPPTSYFVSADPEPTERGPVYPAIKDSVQVKDTTGHLIFNLSTPIEPNNEPVPIRLVTWVHRDWAGKPVSAFVWNDLPDSDPGDNCCSAIPEFPAGWAAPYS